MKVSFSSSGSFDKTERSLRALAKLDLAGVIQSQAQRGVQALARATPQDSGLTSVSWDVDIVKSSNSLRIIWTNSDIENGYPVAIMIQMGHGTGTGGYIHGIDYINPAMRSVFEDIAQTVWKAVISA